MAPDELIAMSSPYSRRDTAAQATVSSWIAGRNHGRGLVPGWRTLRPKTLTPSVSTLAFFASMAGHSQAPVRQAEVRHLW
jgi:hypothetical protein